MRATASIIQPNYSKNQFSIREFPPSSYFTDKTLSTKPEGDMRKIKKGRTFERNFFSFQCALELHIRRRWKARKENKGIREMFRNFNHVIGTQGKKNNGRKLIKRNEKKGELRINIYRHVARKITRTFI